MILLDTHIWLWALIGDRRFPERLKDILEGRPETVYVSPVSVWEALVLAERGGIKLGDFPAMFLKTSIRESAFQEAPLTIEIALLSRELPFSHNDPADRFLAATAKAYGMPLATVDERLIALPWLKTV